MRSHISYKDLLLKMLSIPATSRKEDHRSDFLETYLRGKGMEINRTHNNILVGDPEQTDTKPVILLNSHMDTVAPTEGWKTDPFRPRLEDGKITGLGSNDAGASVVSLIAVYEHIFKKLRKHVNLLLLISAEEEVSGPHGISAVIDSFGRVDAVVVGEPTGMKPAVAERGLMVLDGEVKGKAGHAARMEGENAIYKALDDIEAIAALQFPQKSEWLPDPCAQVTMITAGTQHNTVPDLCSYVVDVRSNDRYGNETMLEMIRSVCAAELRPRSTRLKPSCLQKGHPLMEAIRQSGLSPFGSSTLSDMSLIPFPAVKLGPGDSARSHTAEEYILVKELDHAVEVYSHFLETLSEIMIREGEKMTDRNIIKTSGL